MSLKKSEPLTGAERFADITGGCLALLIFVGLMFAVNFGISLLPKVVSDWSGNLILLGSIIFVLKPVARVMYDRAREQVKNGLWSTNQVALSRLDYTQPSPRAKLLLQLLPLKYREDMVDDLQEDYELFKADHGEKKAYYFYWWQVIAAYLAPIIQGGLIGGAAAAIRKLVGW